jgi:hypothetical protein
MHPSIHTSIYPSTHSLITQLIHYPLTRPSQTCDVRFDETQWLQHSITTAAVTEGYEAAADALACALATAEEYRCDASDRLARLHEHARGVRVDCLLTACRMWHETEVVVGESTLDALRRHPAYAALVMAMASASDGSESGINDVIVDDNGDVIVGDPCLRRGSSSSVGDALWEKRREVSRMIAKLARMVTTQAGDGSGGDGGDGDDQERPVVPGGASNTITDSGVGNTAATMSPVASSPPAVAGTAIDGRGFDPWASNPTSLTTRLASIDEHAAATLASARACHEHTLQLNASLSSARETRAHRLSESIDRLARQASLLHSNISMARKELEAKQKLDAAAVELEAALAAALAMDDVLQNGSHKEPSKDAASSTGTAAPSIVRYHYPALDTDQTMAMAVHEVKEPVRKCASEVEVLQTVVQNLVQ